MARNLTGVTSPSDTYDDVRANVKATHEAGLPILVGTNAFDQNPAVLVPMDITLYYELANLVDAGFTPAEALRAATVLSAHLHNLTDRGVIEPGKRVDLLLSNRNPLVNISNPKDIVEVWIGGIEYQDESKRSATKTRSCNCRIALGRVGACPLYSTQAGCTIDPSGIPRKKNVL